MKENNLKSLHIVWFQLPDILERQNYLDGKDTSCCQAGEWGWICEVHWYSGVVKRRHETSQYMISCIYQKLHSFTAQGKNFEVCQLKNKNRKHLKE